MDLLGRIHLRSTGRRQPSSATTTPITASTDPPGRAWPPQGHEKGPLNELSSDDPEQDLESLGQRYLAYAREHPLEYRLMFSTSWPESAEELNLVGDATQAFDVLGGVLRRMHGDTAQARELIDLDALYIWSTMHGLAGVMNGQCIEQLGLKARVLKSAIRHAMDRMSSGLANAP